MVILNLLDLSSHWTFWWSSGEVGPQVIIGRVYLFYSLFGALQVLWESRILACNYECIVRLWPPPELIILKVISRGRSAFSQYLSWQAILPRGCSSYLSNMDGHLFLITQALHTILYFYLYCYSSRVGSKKIGLLMLLLWAVAEDNEACILEEGLKNDCSKTPILSSDRESAQNSPSVAKGTVPSTTAAWRSSPNQMWISPKMT